MAISRGHRFAIEFAEAFPQGLMLLGISARTSATTRIRTLRRSRSWMWRRTGHRSRGSVDGKRR